MCTISGSQSGRVCDRLSLQPADHSRRLKCSENRPIGKRRRSGGRGRVGDVTDGAIAECEPPQLRVREEENRVAVRAPRWKLCSFSAGQRFRAIRIERATPQRRRPCASCDEDDVPFVGGDRGVERLVAGAELSARWSAECEREWRRRRWRHLSEVPHNGNREADDGQDQDADDPLQNFRDHVVGQRSTTTFFSV